MPRGTNPNSLKNLESGAATRFNGETAVIASAKSVVSRKKKKSMRELARLIGDTQVDSAKVKKQLETIGVPKKELTNNAMVLAAVFQAAIRGDMKAVDKWMELIGQNEVRPEKADGQLAALIDGLKEPYNDIHTETAGADGAVENKPPEAD